MSITATLYVDGVRVADGTPGDDAAAPTALTGLSVTWGRATTIDQPEPATCTFDVMDPAGGAAFLNLLYVGGAVDVRAGGTVQSPPILPINADTSFEAATPGAAPALWNVPPTRVAQVFRGSADQVHTGVQAVAVTAAAAVTGSTVIVARPAPGSSPAAWDDLPRARLGEHWAARLYWTGPLGVKVTVGVVAFTAPAAAAVPAGPPVADVSIGAGGWVMLEATIVVDDAAAGSWLGQSVDVTWPAWTAGQGAWQDYPDTWSAAALAYIDDQQILAPDAAGVVDRDVLVFAGRITDVTAGWDASIGCVLCNVTAVDFTADLANRYVGDVPWPAQTVTARFGRIMTAAGAAVGYRIDPALAGQVMSWMDVDNQPALGLLQDVATSVDGVLWAAMHSGASPVLYLSDPAQQSALYRLTIVGGVVQIVATAAADNVIDLDSCDVLRDPVTFVQSASDVTTRVAVSWLAQTVDDTGNPATSDQSVELVDAAAEPAFGVRRVAVTTLQTTQAAAMKIATRILGRLRRHSWRLTRLVYDTSAVDLDPRQTAAALDLLDGVRRLAAPIVLGNLPYWTPAGAGSSLPLYLQGGIYQYVGGAWVLDLTTASAQSQGTSLPWTAPTNEYIWTAFPTPIVWTDLIGVTI
jgi:hypothetical protein